VQEAVPTQPSVPSRTRAATATGSAAPGRRPGRPKRQAILPEALIGERYIDFIQRHLQRLRQAYDHANRDLHYDQYLAAYLLAFFNPTVRSLRGMEDMSQIEAVQEMLDIDCIHRNTFSAASHLFDAELLQPIIDDLRARVPDLKQRDPHLATILKSIVAADGSYFTIASHVAWALHHRKSNGLVQGEIRLNMQVRVLDCVPGNLSVSGQAQGKEAGAMKDLLEPQTVYVVDRHYVDFDFMNAVLGIGSDFVIRCRSNAPVFASERDLPLRAEDRAGGVISDRLGHLPGCRAAPDAPRQMLREVTIFNAEKQEMVRIVTTLLDVEAAAVGLIYRYRWQVELFFRWLKVIAAFEHLWAHTQNGLTIQFYVAVIAVLLIYVRLGCKPSKYAFSMLSFVASGQATMEEILPILERRERERALARARVRRKAQKNAR
jgi:Transposase DDE domain